jgi:hypothetical protein
MYRLVLLAVVASAISLACGGGDENRKPASNVIVNGAPTDAPSAQPENTELKRRVEGELRKNGFDKVTFDTTTSPPTIRGEYPKGRLAELIQTARIASGREVQNGATETR